MGCFVDESDFNVVVLLELEVIIIGLFKYINYSF